VDRELVVTVTALAIDSSYLPGVRDRIRAESLMTGDASEIGVGGFQENRGINKQRHRATAPLHGERRFTMTDQTRFFAEGGGVGNTNESDGDT
jgi:hypothetical protein